VSSSGELVVDGNRLFGCSMSADNSKAFMTVECNRFARSRIVVMLRIYDEGAISVGRDIMTLLSCLSTY
jgi:hypothetical protein